MPLDYIPNEFARGWIANDYSTRAAILVRLAYIDINDGHHVDAIMFSRIMFWHEPNRETGQTRMRRFRDGFFWITKNHNDWWEECRISRGTARKCLDRIQGRGLIVYELHGESGNQCPWIRINWDEFELRMKRALGDLAAGVQSAQPSEDDEPDDSIPAQSEQGGVLVRTGGAVQTEQGAAQTEHFQYRYDSRYDSRKRSTRLARRGCGLEKSNHRSKQR